ncbi:2Fe-2S iron-sulfur cluster-binding protein [Roseivirga sp. E12]|uniref:2Fe-2S iron-sulfur cluster-binding protein n=1 Tax=Roseivirga sp. E12 TaxID=2819237 RepID=UPI001ABCD43B|nr:2Fe-2S iron-sulfur cluster-binding protein [Roseivirga sp. E12]MBO3698957.1 (2Fe-2S)-binding protein [Roseivirga sp. E12]
MPKILIRNLNNKVIIANDSSSSILNAIHNADVDWMHACGAKGRCTTCKMVVHSGIESFDPDSEAETKFRALGKLKDNERLSCQNKLKEDVEISVAEVNKFPHMNYTD